jgi:DNA-binding SARP family transcriptional activator
VLALLARSGSRGVSRAKLLALLWPDASDEQGRRVVTQALYALRRDMGDERAIAGTQDLRLDSNVVWCDVCEFEAALDRGRPTAPPRSTPDRSSMASGSPVLQSSSAGLMTRVRHCSTSCTTRWKPCSRGRARR